MAKKASLEVQEYLPGSTVKVDFISVIGQPEKDRAIDCEVVEHHRILSAWKDQQGALTTLVTVRKPDSKKDICVSIGRFVG